MGFELDGILLYIYIFIIVYPCGILLCSMRSQSVVYLKVGQIK